MVRQGPVVLHRPWQRNPVVILGFVLWVAMLAFGLQGFVERMQSDALFSDLQSWMPWGLWVASYIWFIGLSAGSFLLSTLVYVFGLKRLERVGKLALVVALITLIMAMMMIAFDVGHMSRLFEIYYRPQFHSMMAWMGWLYGAYFLLLVFETYFVLHADFVNGRALAGGQGAVARFLSFGRRESLTERDLRRDRRIVGVLATIGIPLAFAFHGGVGALFGTVDARDVWHTGLYPIIFLTGAFLTGGALFTSIFAFFWPNQDGAWREIVLTLAKIVLVLLLFDVLLEWADLSIPLWYGIGPEVAELKYMMFGPFWWSFWGVSLTAGVIVPLLLLTIGRNSPKAISWAGVLIVVSYLATRVNLVVPGLQSPELPNLQYSYHDGRLLYHYVPTWSEWELVLFVCALGIALLVIAARVLPTIMGRELS